VDYRGSDDADCRVSDPGLAAVTGGKCGFSAANCGLPPALNTIEGLEASLGIRLVPRSQNPTDGLILRTAGAPERCNDATLAQLAPVASLIVDAELARTMVTDKVCK